ncbi:MAG: hypothetical protein Greene041619_720 [Candidatus Peregrinibacteria bacterium Greene0416_19]|nr:MAG: hypothetical protein Greene041619_720 [Candidatus Peregrinibacteria bacterium Greene0416_19]
MIEHSKQMPMNEKATPRDGIPETDGFDPDQSNVGAAQVNIANRLSAIMSVNDLTTAAKLDYTAWGPLPRILDAQIHRGVTPYTNELDQANFQLIKWLDERLLHSQHRTGDYKIQLAQVPEFAATLAEVRYERDAGGENIEEKALVYLTKNPASSVVLRQADHPSDDLGSEP